MPRRRTARFERTFDLPPDRVWQSVSDTERLSRAGGAPFSPYTAELVTEPDGRVVRHARKRFGPWTLRWRERFGEWSDGRFLRQVRDFTNGPIRRMAMTLRLEPAGSGTRLSGDLLFTWAGLIGDAAFRMGLAERSARALVDTFADLVEADRTGAESDEALPQPFAPAPQPDAKKQLDAALALIAEGPFGHGLEKQLGEYLTRTDPLDLRRIRPLALAEQWQARPDEVVELVLAAHRAGILSMRWEIMCPRCRGGKGATDVLTDLADQVHCDSCNIDFERDFERNVELVFAPEPWLCAIPDEEFCLIGPARARHVRLQREVEQGETIVAHLQLKPGRYRLRTIEPGGEVEYEHKGETFPTVIVEGAQVSTETADPDTEPGTVTMMNRGHDTRTVVIETTAWDSIALTGSKVIASQAFRDLCPEQVLRPGDEVSIGQVAILFSDLRGSTALYERIGDTGAYALVREHFDFMTDRVRRNGGAVVKTIGDAVMAAFPNSPDAVRAAMEIQRDIGAFNASRADRTIELKIGVHAGACIAVTSKGLLDYFGTTVNQAARLQSIGRGGEIVLSADVMANEGVRRAIGDRPVESERVELAGLPGEALCHRLRA